MQNIKKIIGSTVVAGAVAFALSASANSTTPGTKVADNHEGAKAGEKGCGEKGGEKKCGGEKKKAKKGKHAAKDGEKGCGAKSCGEGKPAAEAAKPAEKAAH